jgi:hypothetical protein
LPAKKFALTFETVEIKTQRVMKMLFRYMAEVNLLFVGLLAALLFFGCAIEWNRPPGVSEQTYKQDRDNCMGIAGYTDSNALPGSPAHRFYIACMETAGYTRK